METVAPTVKRLTTMRETGVRSLGQEDSPGEGNANPLQYSCLENPMDRGVYSSLYGQRLQSMGSQRVGHDWATSLSLWAAHPLAVSDFAIRVHFSLRSSCRCGQLFSADTFRCPRAFPDCLSPSASTRCSFVSTFGGVMPNLLIKSLLPLCLVHDMAATSSDQPLVWFFFSFSPTQLSCGQRRRVGGKPPAP